MNYELVKWDDTVGELNDFVLENKRTTGEHLLIMGDSTYVLLVSSPKPNSGYRIELIGAEITDNSAKMIVKDTEPARGMIVMHAFQTPYLLIKVPGRIENLTTLWQ